MGKYDEDGFDPYAARFTPDENVEEEEFRFIESMEYLIENETDLAGRQMASFNLASYYRNIRKFRLAKKYYEICADLGDNFSKEQLGFIWYYGLCGEQSFEKAFQLFRDVNFERSRYMIADMYHYGQYVEKDIDKCRELLEDLFSKVKKERSDPRFFISTLFPEVALRLVQLHIEEEKENLLDLYCLYDARDILAIRQQRAPFWGNIKTMHRILETTKNLCGTDYRFSDLYDLLIGMDEENLSDMNRILGGDPDGKLHYLMEYTARPEHKIADPWYTRQFDLCVMEITEGCEGLLRDIDSQIDSQLR